jgi:acyl-CoA reductase-like NAD-dependent aldehyde dehydrogenase
MTPTKMRSESQTTPIMVFTAPSSGPTYRARDAWLLNCAAGRVVINGMTDDPQAPWGGFKFSGVGREYGAYGISAFLETRAILEVA